jgi:hypothetical protein
MISRRRASFALASSALLAAIISVVVVVAGDKDNKQGWVYGSMYVLPFVRASICSKNRNDNNILSPDAAAAAWEGKREGRDSSGRNEVGWCCYI